MSSGEGLITSLPSEEHRVTSVCCLGSWTPFMTKEDVVRSTGVAPREADAHLSSTKEIDKLC